MALLGLLNRTVHGGLDDLAVQASRLLPLHPLELRLGPLPGDPTQIARGLPPLAPLSIPLGTRRQHLCLPSPVSGVAPPNDVLHLDVVPPPGRSRGVVVVSPFWMVPSPWALTPYLRLTRELGLHAVIYTPPDHMRRTPPGYWTGERLLGWDFDHMQRMMQLALGELVAICRAVQGNGRPVYLVGMSLGGLFAALAAQSGAPLSGLALLTPAADMQVSMGRTAIGRRYRELLERRGMRVPSEEFLTAMGAPYRATGHDRPLEAERIFLAHGRHDAVVPYGVATTLASRWQVPLRSYESGHMSLLFLEPQVRQDLRAFLAQRLQADSPWTVPARRNGVPHARRAGWWPDPALAGRAQDPPAAAGGGLRR